jgi:hypothetical protein
MEYPSKPKGKGKLVSPLHIKAFFKRVVVEGEIFDAVVSETVDEFGERTLSSLPHLTHKKDQRDAHITSSRVVATSDNHVIHQRFHQNDDGLSEPTHDRFFAVDKTTGVVHAASAKFNPEIHIGKKDTLPMRGHTLPQTEGVICKLVFTIGDVDDKVPPLSPRSRKRELGPHGYK